MQPSPVLQKSLRRLALTTKQAGRGFYKGTGSGSMGWHTKHGGYVIDWRKVRTYVVPSELENCRVRVIRLEIQSGGGADANVWEQLTPFVSRKIEKPKQPLSTNPGLDYLERWKMENGEQ